MERIKETKDFKKIANIVQCTSSLKSKTLLAREVYPVERGNFTSLTQEHIQFFVNLLGKERVLTNEKDLHSYNEFWFKSFRGTSQLVLCPATTNEVSEILKYCNQNKLAVCPQGGNTSISGGCISLFDEITLSLSHMNKIIELDDYSDVLICEGGCILEQLNNFLSEKNLLMPVDLASKSSCQIGGIVATNAGGLRLLQFGNLHGSVLGVEVVKANGDVLDCLNSLKKDNTGYHLKHLFLGSEGTLGIITKVAIHCAIRPQSHCVGFLGLQSFDKVLETYKQAKSILSETLSACEMLDYESMDMVQSNLTIKNPIGDFPFYMLVESAGANNEHNKAKLDEFVAVCTEKKLILTASTTADPEQCKSFWKVRENCAESIRRDGYVLLYDLSFRLKDFYNIVEDLRKTIGNTCKRICGLGHLGDGNLHLQITMKEYNDQLKKNIDDTVYKMVENLKGSISAEHGIGFMKTDILSISKSSSSIHLMREVKDLLDPNGILNPYKVIKK